MPEVPDIISLESAVTLDGLFAERVRRTPAAEAYRHFSEAEGSWRSYTWAHMASEIARWQAALLREGLQPGERVALMLRNCPAWVMFDQAALGVGLVVVPLYTADRPDNVAYILNDAGVKVLLFEAAEQWRALAAVRDRLPGVQRFVSLEPLSDGPEDARLRWAGEWLPDQGGEFRHMPQEAQRLATIIYTSGTTGRPKGVMLSHHNILANAYYSLKTLAVRHDDLFLSFLPLSHTFERTVGYYLTIMAGATVAYARSIPLLAEDLQIIRPTVLISVPRIYERVYAGIQAKLAEGPALKRRLFQLAVEVGWSRFEHAQGRGPWRLSHLLWPLLDHLVAQKVLARMGGRLRVALSGGAALSPEISQVFIGLGLPILQGYGLTETSPVVGVNRIDDNLPASIGLPIEGVAVKTGEKDALLVKGHNVMLGYWNNEQATRAMISDDGWLNTGDTARIDEAGHIFITGRIKEIIVLSNGEKVPPVDMETAILRDPLFEQVMLAGEGRPYLSVVAVLNREKWDKLAAEHGVSSDIRSQQAESFALERIAHQVRDFPGYAQVRRAALLTEPWTVDNDLLTPTLKLRRARVYEHCRAEIERLYEGH